MVTSIRQRQKKAFTQKPHRKVITAIPCFNTQKSIAEVVGKSRRFSSEVVVIDDGSRDLTAEVSRSSGAYVKSHRVNKGYGEAIKSCLQVAQAHEADIVVIIDGDGQHDPLDIPRLIEPITAGEADLVIGSRFIANGHDVPSYRQFGIKVINSLWNFGSRVKVSDSQSGFRAYSKKALETLNFSERGMGISIEILEKTRNLGLKIKEVPIKCSYENNNTTLSYKALKHGLGVALSVLKIRLKSGISLAS
jgi:glycosyltransferase involved in cell wall biosynthesis